MARYDYRCDDEHVTEHKFDIGTAPDSVVCPCNLEAKRLLATNTSFMINKIMSPPSQRLKPGQINL